MSTIATTNLKHPSSAVNNMVLSSNGNVTAATKFIGSGLDHIVTQSFSAVSSVNINNCFSNSYLNYRIIASIRTSGAPLILMRTRSSGSDITSANYYHQYNGHYSTTFTYNTNNGGTSFRFGFSGSSSNPATYSADVFNPFQSEFMSFTSSGQTYDPSVSSMVNVVVSGLQNLTTSMDGFTLYPDSGTFSGTVRVYGYENT